MKVKAKKNLIYNGTFRKAGEIFPMQDADAHDYEKRGWVATPVKVKTAPDLPAGLPPLEVTPHGKKK